MTKDKDELAAKKRKRRKSKNNVKEKAKRIISRRHTRTHTDILAERHARIKIVIASRNKFNVTWSVGFCGYNKKYGYFADNCACTVFAQLIPDNNRNCPKF